MEETPEASIAEVLDHPGRSRMSHDDGVAEDAEAFKTSVDHPDLYSSSCDNELEQEGAVGLKESRKIEQGSRHGTVVRAGTSITPASKRRESKITKPSVTRVPESVTSNGNAENCSTQRRRRSPRVLRDATLAQSVDILKFGLRRSDAATEVNTTPRKAQTGPTQPLEFQFHSTHKRPLPKSTEEMEQELMNELRSHQFKARPVPEFVRFSKETSESNNLSGDDGTVGTEPAASEAPKPFKARPIPLTTYIPHEHPARRSLSRTAENEPKTTHMDSPSHASVKRSPSKSSAPIVSVEKSPSDAEAQESARPNVSTPRDVKPFQLRSLARHEEYQKHLQEQIRQEQEEAKRLAEFRARPFDKSKISLPQRSATKLESGKPSPYDRLRSNTRIGNGKSSVPASPAHEESADSEPAFTFKARPLPKGLYSASTSPRRSVAKSSPSVPLQEQPEWPSSKNERDHNYEPNRHMIDAILLSEMQKHRKHAPLSPNDALVPYHGNETTKTSSKGVVDSSSHGAVDAIQVIKPHDRRRIATDGSASREDVAKLNDRRITENVDRCSKAPKAPASTETPTKPHLLPGNDIDVPSVGFLGILGVFLLTSAIRLLGTLMIQSYFDPDEFWQSLEPAYCLIFRSDQGLRCPGYTWEWKRRASLTVANWFERSMEGPVRSHVSLLPTYLLYWAAQRWSIDSWWLVARGPMLVSALVVAAPVDVAVWYSARQLYASEGALHAKNLAGWCLFVNLASWFHGYSLSRTYSNSQETMLLAVALFLVSPAFLNPRNTRLSTSRACAAFFLGGLSATIRFTSLAAFVPMGVILARRLRSTKFGTLGYLLVPCATFGLGGLLVGAAVDRYFYGFWTLPVLGNFHFNVILNLSSLYGTHPWHWYLTAGLPAISGLLLPLMVLSMARLLRGRATSGEGNLWLVIGIYLCIMSLNSHKEFRFIHPLLPLICLLSGRFMYRLARGRRWRKAGLCFLFLMANLAPVAYLGLFHQSGPISVNRAIVEEAQWLAKGGFGRVDANSFSVYYLTECHSAPLHSHLHAPPLRFDAWQLDCSPDCRSDSRTLCESDRFALDPAAFVEAAVCPSGSEAGADGDSCSSSDAYDDAGFGITKRRPAPDFLVTYASRIPALRDWMRRTGLSEVARYPHHINGAQLGGWLRLGDGWGDGGDDAPASPFRSWSILGVEGSMGLELRLEDVVLLSRHSRALRPTALPRIYRYSPAALLRGIQTAKQLLAS